ncbi:polyribonucleotide nucleotidyltransferase 1 [Nomia melanderi]|uniref:polyribonucleotide nucleotidyltransferase 1 n=1 Tax=Nomia melanderi TaxID=2448451 RepID=UPI003FCC7C54
MKMVLLRCGSKLLKSRNLIFLQQRNHIRNGNVHGATQSNEFEEQTAEIQLSDGKKIRFSTGKFARFAGGCVTAKFGDTSVMSIAVRQNEPVHSDMIPLTVDYRQKAAAVGRIPSNYFRRDLRQTEHEILTSRLIDRSIRPLFPKDYRYETQITCNLLAVDGFNDPEVLAINAASAVLSISDIPWNGPIGAVRIGLIDNQFVVHPSRRDLQHSILNLVVACTSKNLVVMIEGSANDILEQDLRKAIRLAAKECQLIISSIIELQKCVRRSKIQIPENVETNCMIEPVREFAEKEIENIFTCYSHDKITRDNALDNLRKETLYNVAKDNPEVTSAVMEAFQELVKDTFRSLIFQTNKRCDGRKLRQLRSISCQVNLLEPLHGSAFFQRGQTQVLCTVTLDSIENALKMDSISMLASGLKDKNFFLHYEFPPYATNEIGKLTRVNRREIGHGALAEKGLRPVIPKDYPFAIRLTSEVLESNGSSSMASVCGGSMALMDAGIPISSQVAGVAIGLICKFSKDGQIEDYKILLDILGIEDYLGDIDFKLTGTKKGFTALQLDVKVPGIPVKAIMECIQCATEGKSKIIQIMNSVISSPREKNKQNMPVFETIEVPIHQRAKFIGVGGLNLKKILTETGVHIDAKEQNIFSLFAPNQDAMNEAKNIIQEALTTQAEPTLIFGDIYTGKIIEIRDSGVMITLHPQMQPILLSNSQLDRRKVHHPSALGFEVGQEIQVKYFGRDPVNGQVRLSRKVLQEPVSNTQNFFPKLDDNN